MSKVVDSIGYSGKVTVSLTRGKGKPVNKFKNTGMQPLFNLIASSLAGYDTKRKVPAYFDISNGSYSLLMKPVPLTGITWSDKDAGGTPVGSSLKMAAVVMTSDKRDATVSNQELLYRIINVDGEVLAQIRGQELSQLYNQVQVGVDMLVEWIFTFSNMSSDTN